MVEYIVAIDVTRVRFPADAQAPNATLVHKVNEVKRVAESVITIVKTWALWSRGGVVGGGLEVCTLFRSPVPCMWCCIPATPILLSYQ